mgnify:CR=1 FL=1
MKSVLSVFASLALLAAFSVSALAAEDVLKGEVKTLEGKKVDLSQYKGKVVFQSASASSFGLHAFLMFNRIQGGTEANVEPGFTKFRDTIGKNVLEFIPSSAKIAEMAQTGEAAIFPLTPTGISTLKDKGIAVEYAQPKEGSVVLMVAQCVIARNSEPELAQKLAAYLLSPEAQSKALAAGNIVPSNTKAKASTPASVIALRSGYGRRVPFGRRWKMPTPLSRSRSCG